MVISRYKVLDISSYDVAVFGNVHLFKFINRTFHFESNANLRQNWNIVMSIET